MNHKALKEKITFRFLGKKKKKIKAAVVTHSVEVSVRVQAVFIAFLLYLSISGIWIMSKKGTMGDNVILPTLVFLKYPY